MSHSCGKQNCPCRPGGEGQGSRRPKLENLVLTLSGRNMTVAWWSWHPQERKALVCASSINCWKWKPWKMLCQKNLPHSYTLAKALLVWLWASQLGLRSFWPCSSTSSPEGPKIPPAVTCDLEKCELAICTGWGSERMLWALRWMLVQLWKKASRTAFCWSVPCLVMIGLCWACLQACGV